MGRLAQLSCLALLASTTLATPPTVKLDFKREAIAKPLSRRANGELSVALAENSQQNSYIIDLSIGTPAQSFKLILDTGSSDLWVPGQEDTTCEGQDSPCTFGTYSSSASRSYSLVEQGNFFISYGDGSEVVGDYINDVVTIGGAKVSNVTFGLALQGQSPNPEETAQGILGVGYTTLSSSNGTFPTLVDALFTSGAINRRAFSLYLNDVDSGTGSILFGGVDTDKYTGDLVSLPVSPDIINGQSVYARYLVDLSGVSFTTGKSSSIISPSGYATAALLDSGTTEILIGQTIFNSIVQGIGATPLNEEGETIYLANCDVGNGDGAIGFTFGGGITIKVPISALLQDTGTPFGDGSEACLLLIQATSDDLPNTILGDAFLRSAYVVYDIDNNQISLAQANLNSTSSNIQVIPSGIAGISQASSTATATASPYTLDNAATTGIQTGGGAAATTSVLGATNIPQSAGKPTFSGLSGAAAGTGSGSGSSSSASGAANHVGVVASTPMGTMQMGVLVSVAACFFAGMLVL